MTPSKGEDISSPGRLLLIDEGSSAEPSILRDMDPSGTIKPALRACECNTHPKLPALPGSKTPAPGIVGGHQVESTPW